MGCAICLATSTTQNPSGNRYGGALELGKVCGVQPVSGRTRVESISLSCTPVAGNLQVWTTGRVALQGCGSR